MEQLNKQEKCIVSMGRDTPAFSATRQLLYRLQNLGAIGFVGLAI